jgi:hypothetical protein
MQIIRSILAVLAGMVTVVVLSEGTDFLLGKLGVLSFDVPDPTVPFVFATLYRSIAAVVGGYVTARLAPGAPMAHAIILGAIGTALALAGVLTHLSAPNLWYPIALVVTALPCSWLGGKIAAKA